MNCEGRKTPHVPITYSEWNTGIGEICLICKERFNFPLNLKGEVERKRYIDTHEFEFTQPNDPRFEWAKEVRKYT